MIGIWWEMIMVCVGALAYTWGDQEIVCPYL